jgi:hypothetical protein
MLLFLCLTVTTVSAISEKLLFGNFSTAHQSCSRHQVKKRTGARFHYSAFDDEIDT